MASSWARSEVRPLQGSLIEAVQHGFSGQDKAAPCSRRAIVSPRGNYVEGQEIVARCSDPYCRTVFLGVEERVVFRIRKYRASLPRFGELENGPNFT